MVPANKKSYLTVGVSIEFKKIPKNRVMLGLTNIEKENFSTSPMVEIRGTLEGKILLKNGEKYDKFALSGYNFLQTNL